MNTCMSDVMYCLYMDDIKLEYLILLHVNAHIQPLPVICYLLILRYAKMITLAT
jgi:hypothetical protein